MRRTWQIAAFIALSLAATARADEPKLSFGILDVERIDFGSTTDLTLTLSASTANLEAELTSAIAEYMRNARPKLFGTISLGVLRYRSGRLVPTGSRVWIDPKDQRDNAVQYEITADIVAHKESLSVSCDRDGWKLRCDRKWVDEGTTTIANAEVVGSVEVEARPDTRLTDRPVHLKLYASRVAGSVLLGALGDINLSLDIGETKLDEFDVGIPKTIASRYDELGNWVLRSLKVQRSVKKSRIRLNVGVARSDEPK